MGSFPRQAKDPTLQNGRSGGESGQDFGSVAFGSNFVPDPFDLSIGPDEEAAAHNSFKGASHEFLGAPGTIGFDHLVRWVAKKGKIQFLFGPEALQGLDRVGAGADNDHAQFIELRFCVTKLGRLNCSTRSVCFRKEKKEDAFPPETRKGDVFSLIGCQGEFRGFVADSEHESSLESG